MTTLISRRLTPWGRKDNHPLPLLEEGRQSTPEERTVAPRVFVLKGVYLYDPERATTADFRSFLFASLQVLRSEAERRGLPEAEISQLVTAGFDKLHDEADRLWEAMRKVVTAPPGGTAPPPATVAAPSPGESPEQVELRRIRLRRESRAAYNRARHDEDLRDMLDLEAE